MEAKHDHRRRLSARRSYCRVDFSLSFSRIESWLEQGELIGAGLLARVSARWCVSCLLSAAGLVGGRLLALGLLLPPPHTRKHTLSPPPPPPPLCLCKTTTLHSLNSSLTANYLPFTIYLCISPPKCNQSTSSTRAVQARIGRTIGLVRRSASLCPSHPETTGLV